MAKGRMSAFCRVFLNGTSTASFFKKTSIQFHIILMIKMVHLISRAGFELTITWTRVSYHHLSTIRDFRPLHSVFPTWSLWSKVQLKFTTISLKQLVKHTFSTTQFIKKIGHSCLFFFIFVFSTVNRNMFIIKFCRCLDSNRGPLVANWATTTAHQPIRLT